MWYHLWMPSSQSGANKHPATGYPAKHRKIHATTLTYCQVITHTVFYSLPNWYSCKLWLMPRSIHPIPTCGILYISTVLNTTIQKVPKPPFVTKCTFETNFLSSCCRLAARAVYKQRGDCSRKFNSPDTLCELLTRRLLFSPRLHI